MRRRGSVEQLSEDIALSYYLRTGRRVPAGEFATDVRAAIETKFNPWHDRLGRFTFPPGGPRDLYHPERVAVRRTGEPKRTSDNAPSRTMTGSTQSATNPKTSAPKTADAVANARQTSEPAWLRDYPDRDRLRGVFASGTTEPLEAPDGAFYVVPDDVDEKYLLGAIAYLRSQPNRLALLTEFRRMYTDPTHPHFIDFKKWGTARGPKGKAAVARISYFSPARGVTVTASPFEAFGNYFYGFAGRMANLSPEELKAAAWLVQEGRRGTIDKYISNFMRDSPEDAPHVNKGIADANRDNASLSAQASPIFGIAQEPGR